MSMEKRKATRAERATTIGPLDRPADDLETPVAPDTDKLLPEITENPIPDLPQLTIQDPASFEQEIRKALTDPRLFETAFSLSFVLGKLPANPDALSFEDLINQGQYYLIILRTQHLLTTASSALSVPELWSLWLLRAEALRLLFAPRLAVLELSRIKIPESARIPWDFQVLKILLLGMASGRWNVAIGEWLIMVSETRAAMAEAKENKDLWKLRLKKLEDLIIYGLIESKDFDLASRHLKGLVRRYPNEHKHIITLFHVYLQMGLLNSAEGLLDSLPADGGRAEASAILALAKEDYSTAIKLYTSLFDSNSHHMLMYSSNLSLAYLYTANGQSAIAALEPSLQEPRSGVGILPYAAYNLCTMYEIRDDKARARKEGIMETVVGRFGDICGKAHFKLDSLR